MNGILLDTNVVSETVRREPDANVVAFLSSEPNLWLSVIVLHELEYGIGLMAPGRRRDAIASAVRSIASAVRRIVPVGPAEAEYAAELRANARRAGRTLELGDALIAATAGVRRLGLATRNVSDFEGLDLRLIDPWEHMGDAPAAVPADG
ncbi:PIN domain-containing protein [Candidatus Poriferisodalis sp.]|uniref:PIN domain-containing protein n=1 Tax=Candidatus Poriferisodalis sp. TaxID=3101277 RepID=UPI003B011FCE